MRRAAKLIRHPNHRYPAYVTLTLVIPYLTHSEYDLNALNVVRRYRSAKYLTLHVLVGIIGKHPQRIGIQTDE